MPPQDDDRSDEAATAEPSTATDRDVVFVHSQQEDGGFRVIRARNDNVEVGVMRTPRDGQPLIGELVKLEPTEEHQQLFSCETIAKGHMPTPSPASSPAPSPASSPAPSPAPSRAHPGPARVATAAYRHGWDSIFGAPDDEPPDPSTLN